jgi:hypothetical protein
VKTSAVGSFGAWDQRVRGLVHWLTDYDVSEGFRQNKAEDPRRQNDGSLLAALHGVFGDNVFKSADVLAAYTKVANNNPCSPAEQALHDALDETLGTRNANTKIFGYWARRLDGACTEGFLLNVFHDDATNANAITVRRT